MLYAICNLHIYSVNWPPLNPKKPLECFSMLRCLFAMNLSTSLPTKDEKRGSSNNLHLFSSGRDWWFMPVLWLSEKERATSGVVWSLEELSEAQTKRGMIRFYAMIQHWFDLPTQSKALLMCRGLFWTRVWKIWLEQGINQQICSSLWICNLRYLIQKITFRVRFD